MHKGNDNTVEPEIFTRRKFSLISPPALVGYSVNFYPCVIDYREHNNGDLYHIIGKNLNTMSCIFLQHKDS